MKCSHKPKELFKALFVYDDVFTCKKCGKHIWHKSDRADYRHAMQIAGIAIVVLSAVLGM